MHRHLRRLGRVFPAHPIYFITTCTHGRRHVLNVQAAADILVSEWRVAHERHGWVIGRYVIMPDHVHFFCAERPAAAGSTKSLADFVGFWKQWTAKRLRAELHLPTPVWQPEFFDHVLRSDESYAAKWEYVFLNPVRQGLVADASQWPWQGHVDFDEPIPTP